MIRNLIKINRPFITSTASRMPPKQHSSFYAVRTGHKPGIYHTWSECQQQVDRFPGCSFKKFSTIREASEFINDSKLNKNKIIDLVDIQCQTEVKVPILNGRDKRPVEPVNAESDEPSLAKKRRKLENGESIIKQISTNTAKLDAKVESNDKSDWVVVYTDGSSLGNGRLGARAGVGVYFGRNDTRNISECLPPYTFADASRSSSVSNTGQTNQRAEIMAAIRALETIKQDISNHSNSLVINVEIRTDSKYVINSISDWVHSWRRNGWRTASNQPVSNRDLFERLYHLCYGSRDDSGNGKKFNLKWTHVRGHRGELGNEEADKLARMGALMKPLSASKESQ